MSVCQTDPNINNGLLTKIWGPHMWEALHSISFGYPINPTDENKYDYLMYFTFLSKVLPCKYCRESYSHYIITEPTILNSAVLENRGTLTRWLYNMHQRINDKLGIDYGMSYEDIVNRFESYRAKCTAGLPGCVIPLNEKAEAFKVSKIFVPPIITYRLAICFAKYAESRGVSFSELHKYYEYSKDKKNSEWMKRNTECRQLIEDMRLKGIPIIEKEGEFSGLPSVSELQLISKLSSNLRLEELEQLTTKLGVKYNKAYKLIAPL